MDEKEALSRIAMLLGPSDTEGKQWRAFLRQYGADVVMEALDGMLKLELRPGQNRQRPSPWNLYRAVMEIRSERRRKEAQRQREEEERRRIADMKPQEIEKARRKFAATVRRLLGGGGREIGDRLEKEETRR